MTKRRLVVLLFVFILAYAASQVFNMMSKPAAELGANNGRLADCPEKPNCVHSQVEEGPPAIAPLTFSTDAGVAWNALKTAVESMPRTTVVTEKDGYLHCEFRTAIMRYVDDVEFLLDGQNGKIDFRSASRVGYSDMGANRKRMEEVRRRFEDALNGRGS